MDAPDQAARRQGRTIIVVLVVLALAAGCSSSNDASKASAPQSAAAGGSTDAGATTDTGTSVNPAMSATVDKVVKEQMAQRHLRAVIVRVTIDGKNVITKAYGESMPGVPATVDMHWRNGAIAISYVANLLLQLVDEKKVSLDDKVSKYLPDLPHADEVTLRNLAQMTSGYTDYVIGNTENIAKLYADPFRQWTPEELIATVADEPLLYKPGTNWNYAHTNYLILGLALEKATGKKMQDLLQEKVLGPLGLKNTSGNDGTPAIPEPALHAYTSERRSALNIPAGTPFYEESTFWNPSWTITRGAVETTNVFDATTTGDAIGSGKLLSKESHDAMVSTDLRGKTTKLPGCTTCAESSVQYSYGLGVVTTGDWLLQDPLFSGEAGVFANLPSKKVSIGLALTFEPSAFDETDGSYKPEVGNNAADHVWREIATAIEPDDAPPQLPSQ